MVLLLVFVPTQMRPDHAPRKICDKNLTRSCRRRGKCFNFLPARLDRGAETGAA